MEKKYPSNYECLENIAYALLIFAGIVLLALLCQPAKAQNVKRQGNTFIEQPDSTKTKIKGRVYETDMLYVEKDGTAYPIFLSSNGNAFINKVSKKSGRKYRKYLPKVTKEIQNERK